MSSLRDQLHAKERELESIGSKLLGASVGASIMKNSALGMAAGALLGREKGKQAEIERDIEKIKSKMKDTERTISELKTKLSRLQNTFQNDRVNLEANIRQERNALENRRYNASSPDEVRDIERQLSKLQSDSVAKQRQAEREFSIQEDSIQREINSLAL